MAYHRATKAAAMLLMGIAAYLSTGDPPPAVDYRSDRRGKLRGHRHRHLHLASYADPKSIVAKPPLDRRVGVLPAKYQYLPADSDKFIATLHRYRAKKNMKIVYPRREEHFARPHYARGDDGQCPDLTFEVLAWLMDEVNARAGTLMLTYGDLIHLYREGSLVNTETGEYYDDDMNTWASPETFEMIASWENILHEKFGWTLRFLTKGPYAVAMQIFSLCGHDSKSLSGWKIKSGGVAIEVMVLPTMPLVPSDKGFQQGGKKCRDIWSTHSFPASMIYPAKRVDWKQAGREEPLHLQVPNDSLGLLRCVYDTWEVPTSVRSDYYAPRGLDCTNFYSVGEGS